MRWEALFADLAAQADALDVAERAAEVGERARIEFGSVALVDRLRAAAGAELRLRTAGRLTISGVVRRVGADWVLVDEGSGREALVALPAIDMISGLGPWSVPGGDTVLGRLTLRSGLRAIARDRSAVAVYLTDGDVLTATIDRVGADFVEVARHAPGELRRHGSLRDSVVIPLAAIAVVRREAWGG